jgi:hypothetical protein
MNHDGNTHDGYSNKITNRIRDILLENFIESNQPYIEERDSNADNLMIKIVSTLGKTTSEVNQMIPLLAHTKKTSTPPSTPPTSPRNTQSYLHLQIAFFNTMVITFATFFTVNLYTTKYNIKVIFYYTNS